MKMIVISTIGFILAAGLGAILFTYLIQGKQTPKSLAMVHGLLAVTSVLLLIVFSIMYFASLLYVVAIFLIAAILGVTLFFWDILGKKIPKALLFSHVLFAGTGLVLLILVGLHLSGVL